MPKKYDSQQAHAKSAFQLPSDVDRAPPYWDEEIDFQELWDIIWSGKWLIIAVTSVFILGSVIYALMLPNIYRSQVLLAPSEETQGGGLSRMAGQLGGLASLAGINLGNSGGDNKVNVAISVMKSRKFIANFIEEHDVLPELMAIKKWDFSNNQVLFDDEIYDSETKKWLRDVKPPKKTIPSSWEAYEEFMKILTVSQDKETGFVTVSVEHPSPFIAKQWTEWLVQDVNIRMKEKDVLEARKSIDFLHRQLSQVALAEMRTVFYQLIEEQTKTVMLAEVRDEYVFTTIDPPVVAEEKAKPKRALIVFFSAVLGSVLSVLMVFFRHFTNAGLSRSEGRN